MSRLHLKYRVDAFEPRTLELTHRFFQMRKQVSRKAPDVVKGRLFDTWLHGACIVYELPFPSLTVSSNLTEHAQGMPAESLVMAVQGQGQIDVGWYVNEGAGQIHLVRFSAISLFHQFRHHMEANASPSWSHERHGSDAQAWSCSLFYLTDKKLFRKWVRRGRIAGVEPQDLLKRRRYHDGDDS